MVKNPILHKNSWPYLLIGLALFIGVQIWVEVTLLHLDKSFVVANDLISWGVLAIFIFCVTNVLSYAKPKKTSWLLALLGLLVVAYFWWESSNFLLRLVLESSSTVNVSSTAQFYRFFIGYISLVGTFFLTLSWNKIEENKEDLLRSDEIKKLARQAELLKLQQQLQPHFLFNSLNAINALVVANPDKAREMILNLSEFLRGTLVKESQNLIPLKDEIENIKLYLNIEQVRFGHRLAAKINCNKKLHQWQIPPLLLQPIIENAIKYGLYGSTENIVLNLECKTDNNYLILHIQNPFEKNTQNPKSAGFGLKSVKRRLYLLYGRTDLLSIQTKDNIFSVQIKIPPTHDKSIDN